MPRNRVERQTPRRAVRRGYVEYAKAGTRLSRMFKPQVERGPMVDISRSGVQFRTTVLMDVGENLYMTLHFVDAPEPVKLKVVVRWVREDKKVGIENYTHLIGAEFVEFSPHAWDLIAAAMRSE
jgi:hypothetical protein